MIGLIITGHGTFASGMRSAAELIAGPQERLEAVDFTSLAGTDELERDLAGAFGRLDGCDGVLVLCDLVGGSPFKTAVLLSQGRDDVRVVAGTNLGALVDSLLARDGMEVAELAEHAVSQVKAGAVLFTQVDANADLPADGDGI